MNFGQIPAAVETTLPKCWRICPLSDQNTFARSSSAKRAGAQTRWGDGLPVEPSGTRQGVSLPSAPEPGAVPTPRDNTLPPNEPILLRGSCSRQAASHLSARTSAPWPGNRATEHGSSSALGRSRLREIRGKGFPLLPANAFQASPRTGIEKTNQTKPLCSRKFKC